MQDTPLLDRFIIKICLTTIIDCLKKHIEAHPSIFQRRCRFSPDTAELLNTVFEFSFGTVADFNRLSFHVALSCDIHIVGDEYTRNREKDLLYWFDISVDCVIDGCVQSIRVSDIRDYRPGILSKTPARPIGKNLVPIISKAQFEDEATLFLSKFCPEALQHPMKIPLDSIAAQLGLTFQKEHWISDDCSILGQVCFRDCYVPTYSIFANDVHCIPCPRGTILLDAFNIVDRGEGCANNTSAHEMFHWYRHKLYADILSILDDQALVCHRCPKDRCYPKDISDWSEIDWIEWQANGIAPRILMPLEMFLQKTDELYQYYGCKTPAALEVALPLIVEDLAEFFGVSMHSVLIRLTETGHTEAKALLEDYKEEYCQRITPEDAFDEYVRNPDFRSLIDSGEYVYAQGVYVRNDPKYFYSLPFGERCLTIEALDHLNACSLRFRQVHAGTISDPSQVLYKDSSGAFVLDEYCDSLQQGDLEEFERYSHELRILQHSESCPEALTKLFEAHHLKAKDFAQRTHLLEQYFSKYKEITPKKPALLAIVIGLGLDHLETEELLNLAGITLSRTPEDMAYKFCISHFPGNIARCNSFLSARGFPPLGAQTKDPFGY